MIDPPLLQIFVLWGRKVKRCGLRCRCHCFPLRELPRGQGGGRPLTTSPCGAIPACLGQRYKLLQRISSGTFGFVFEAIDLQPKALPTKGDHPPPDPPRHRLTERLRLLGVRCSPMSNQAHCSFNKCTIGPIVRSSACSLDALRQMCNWPHCLFDACPWLTLNEQPQMAQSQMGREPRAWKFLVELGALVII